MKCSVNLRCFERISTPYRTSPSVDGELAGLTNSLDPSYSRCHCNGHANKCTKEGGPSRNETYCECEHNTIGRDCETCHAAYNDAPWQAAGVVDAHPCKGASISTKEIKSDAQQPLLDVSYRAVGRLHSTARLRVLFLFVACVCNGYAKNCTFSRELYDRTGHGSVCIDCAGNRGGPNCESCKLGFYRLPESKGECLACGCDAVGTFCPTSFVPARMCPANDLA